MEGSPRVLDRTWPFEVEPAEAPHRVPPHFHIFRSGWPPHPWQSLPGSRSRQKLRTLPHRPAAGRWSAIERAGGPHSGTRPTTLSGGLDLEVQLKVQKRKAVIVKVVWECLR